MKCDTVRTKPGGDNCRKVIYSAEAYQNHYYKGVYGGHLLAQKYIGANKCDTKMDSVGTVCFNIILKILLQKSEEIKNFHCTSENADRMRLR